MANVLTECNRITGVPLADQPGQDCFACAVHRQKDELVPNCVGIIGLHIPLLFFDETPNFVQFNPATV